ncbi:MAG: tRNA preQ1(34) S-adenosylmethionine ribosyltransferase-isomerase QueA [Elusimicrobia bacterium]|nr:tRNA preQ1(34) S-adenosylmethionine ribosyltransferase-isomerase QueA [Elusimicrobiota bacterium]
MIEIREQGGRFDAEAYDFPYSEALVATSPAEPRDASRLLVLNRATGALSHETFRDVPSHLIAGDCLVLNRTKVLPARLVGRKPTGGKADLLLLREVEPGAWTALSSDLKAGTRVLWDGAEAVAEKPCADEGWIVRFSTTDVRGLMERVGLPPLPPYILKKRKRAAAETGAAPAPEADRQPQDKARYQTVYAKEEGSVAAPTAGLHFTQALLAEIRARGVAVHEVTLHVGHGTFQPITAADVREHRMKSEWYQIPKETAKALSQCRERGGRVIPVGTTATRTLESFALNGKREAWTDIFIRPGHEFKYADALITNFHQPRSTPLVLASAFAGRERLWTAYEAAVAKGYRLYSFGDAMLIV